jgi:hypothetical protein
VEGGGASGQSFGHILEVLLGNVGLGVGQARTGGYIPIKAKAFYDQSLPVDNMTQVLLWLVQDECRRALVGVALAI